MYNKAKVLKLHLTISETPRRYNLRYTECTEFKASAELRLKDHHLPTSTHSLTQVTQMSSEGASGNREKVLTTFDYNISEHIKLNT